MFGLIAPALAQFNEDVVAAAGTDGHTSPTDPLPESWRADIGIPAELDDGTVIRLYGDTIPTEGGLHRQSVMIDDTPVLAPFRTGEEGRWYWPTDGVELADGSLLVAALEMTGGGVLGYEAIDSDGFVVSDPRSPVSWRLAEKVEDPPWGEGQVQFSDQWPLAFARDPYGLDTAVFSFTDPLGEWVEVDTDLPESHGAFAPVQTDTGWWGVTWFMSDQPGEPFDDEATLWRADSLDGEWVEVETRMFTGPGYDHGLNVVGGEVVWRWSQATGDQQVAVETIDL